MCPASPAFSKGSECHMETILTAILISVISDVITNHICKYLDKNKTEKIDSSNLNGLASITSRNPRVPALGFLVLPRETHRIN